MKPVRFVFLICLLFVYSPFVLTQNHYLVRKSHVLEMGPCLESSSQQFNLEVSLDHYFPYCGGAYPDESQLNNYQILSNAHFMLVNLVTGEKDTVRSNENGIIQLTLSPGKYSLKEMFKECSYEAFLEKFRINYSSDYYEQDLSCYKNWWSSGFLEFTIESPKIKQILHYTFAEACFTGNNPCVFYSGPYPP